MLAILSVNLGFAVRQKLIFLKKMDARNRLHFIAEAGIKRAIMEIRKNISELGRVSFSSSLSNNPAIFREIQVGEGAFTVGYSYPLKNFDNFNEDVDVERDKTSKVIRYGVIDEERKININTAEEGVLKRLFQNVVSLSEESAEELAYCIVDWRDEDSNFQHPDYGAESSYYENLRSPYKAKDAEYELLEELLLVKSLNGEIFDKVKDYLTVFGEGKININTVSPEVLSALGLTDKLIDKILFFRSGADFQEGTSDDNIFDSADIITELKEVIALDFSEIGQLEVLISKGQLATISQNFMIQSTAELNNNSKPGEGDIIHPVDNNISGTHQIIAIVDSGGKIKYWRED